MLDTVLPLNNHNQMPLAKVYGAQSVFSPSDNHTTVTANFSRAGGAASQ